MMIPEEGCLLLVDKPLGWTSFDVVKKLRYALRPRKIGHSGTLDPLATGLLLIGANKYTKKLQELQQLDKTYEGVIEIGKTTPSYDLETAFDTESDWQMVTEKNLQQVTTQFRGEISQVPPAHSAIKVDGQRAYKKARKHQTVELKSRQVQVYDFTIDTSRLPEVPFMVRCSKGTYIRSLAHDFGRVLGTGGYLKSLRRTRIGDYDVKDACSPEDLIKRYSVSNEGH